MVSGESLSERDVPRRWPFAGGGLDAGGTGRQAAKNKTARPARQATRTMLDRRRWSDIELTVSLYSVRSTQYQTSFEQLWPVVRRDGQRLATHLLTSDLLTTHPPIPSPHNEH